MGYGSAVTWLDHAKTLDEFDAAVARDPDLGIRVKNQRVRTCLETHAGHDFETHSSDWTHTHPNKLCGEFGSYGACVTIIDDFDVWTHENLVPD